MASCESYCRQTMMRKRSAGSAAAAKVLAVTVLVVVIATMMYVYSVGVLGFKTAGCEMRPIVAGGNGREVELLLTPFEMRQLLYAEVDTVQGSSADPITVSDWRYANMIRSQMTRPNPSRPVRLDSTFITERHFSEVRIDWVISLLEYFLCPTKWNCVASFNCLLAPQKNPFKVTIHVFHNRFPFSVATFAETTLINQISLYYRWQTCGYDAWQNSCARWWPLASVN